MSRELLAKHAPELLLPPREGDSAGWVTPEAEAGLEPPAAMYDESTGTPLNTYREGDGPTQFFVPQGATPTPIRPVGADGLRNRDTGNFHVQDQGPTYTPPQEEAGLEMPPPTNAQTNVPQVVSREPPSVSTVVPPAAPPPRPRAPAAQRPAAPSGPTLGELFRNLNIPLPNILTGTGETGRSRPARPVGEPIGYVSEGNPVPVTQFDPNTGTGDYMAAIGDHADREEQEERRSRSQERQEPDPMARHLGSRRYRY
jgi:hypothetical protein